jgi:hypothetical protein
MIQGYAIRRASAITGRFTNVSAAYFAAWMSDGKHEFSFINAHSAVMALLMALRLGST